VYTSYGHKLYENESERTHEVIKPRLLGEVLQQLDCSDVIATGRERKKNHERKDKHI